jgi:hypothetical protein
MGCSCNKNRTQYEVVVKDGDKEKVVFTASVKTTAEAVSKRYENSEVRPKVRA